MERRSFLKRAIAVLAAPLALIARPRRFNEIYSAGKAFVAAPIAEDPVLQYMAFRRNGGGMDPRVARDKVARKWGNTWPVEYYAKQDSGEWESQFRKFLSNQRLGLSSRGSRNAPWPEWPS